MLAHGRAPRCLCLLLCAAAAAPAQKLTEANCQEARDRVLPTADDLAWAAIPWHATLASGALAAEEADRPLLLWAMHGHPLGVT